ncbi:MAG TPA: beta-L-arabinofuranosidase domain-containing protein [Chitinophagaceae bacterium]|nr:beta-L-arabinofuranosidase domain-containing protein [Chitinophagaceae bacterium]
MKLFLPAIAFFSLCTRLWAQVSNTQYVIVKPLVEEIRTAAPFSFSGYLGDKVEAVIQNNIKKEDVASLVDVFRHRNETSLWQTEFWGKWLLSAAKAYQYNKDEALFDTMKSSTAEIIATQTPDGYIGNYADGKHLGNWDIWGRKYTLLGLIYYYDITGDKAVLQAARHLLDFTLTEVDPGRKNIVLTGAFRGMPSSSILEPVVLLYQRTAEKRYLDFAKYIVAQWETPQGPQLISKALQDVPVARRFSDTLTNNWWSWQNSRKAYEMMSCYDGLLKLYQVTGEKKYLEAVADAVKSIKKEEINIVGSGAAFECWYGGAQKQAYPTMHTMETCVTITWMKLCYELYRFTGDAALVENIETSAYNNLLGSLLPDGSRFSKYSSLQGFRDLDDYQCNMKINCCMANGPRGLMLLQDLAVMQHNNSIYINLYNAGNARFQLNNKAFNIQCETSYPADGSIELHINPSLPINTTVYLRIPSWSSKTTIQVNGSAINEPITAGGYVALQREWKAGDVIHLTFDMRGRVLTLRNNYAQYKAVMRGPIVLARDSRFGNYDIDDEFTNSGNDSTFINLTPISLPGVWLAYTYNFTTGTGEDPVQLNVPLVDFSSAGNEWKASNRYRVWAPVSLDVMKEK